MKVLCISPRTPPAVRPQAILLGKMIPEWICQGIDPVIVSYDNNGKWDIKAPVYTVPAFRASRILGHLAPLQKLNEFFYCMKTSRKIMPILKKEKIEVMFSFANPQICNVIGAFLKLKSNLPFVAHFSDPWVDHPYEKIGPISKFILKRMEHFVINNADAIIFVNPILRDLVMRKYPRSWAHKTRIIPHCFNPSEFDSEPVGKNQIFTIRHIGAFYPQRNPKPMFEALRMILDRGWNKQKFKIQLIGATTGYAGMTAEQLEDMVRSAGISEIVETVPGVEYRESLKLMRRADCLVSIDANIPGSPFLQSKIIDYSYVSVPIICITPTHSPTGQVVEGLGYRSFNYSQIASLAKYLAEIINGENVPQVNVQFRNQFHVKNTTQKLIQCFMELKKQII